MLPNKILSSPRIHVPNPSTFIQYILTSRSVFFHFFILISPLLMLINAENKAFDEDLERIAVIHPKSFHFYGLCFNYVPALYRFLPLLLLYISTIRSVIFHFFYISTLHICRFYANPYRLLLLFIPNPSTFTRTLT